jgi:hypothetical protein
MLSNLPMPVMKRGDRVRWYVMTLGGSVNIHTPHWHGNVVSYVHVVFALPRELTPLALQNKRLISTKTFQTNLPWTVEQLPVGRKNRPVKCNWA